MDTSRSLITYLSKQSSDQWCVLGCNSCEVSVAPAWDDPIKMVIGPPFFLAKSIWIKTWTQSYSKTIQKQKHGKTNVLYSFKHGKTNCLAILSEICFVPGCDFIVTSKALGRSWVKGTSCSRRARRGRIFFSWLFFHGFYPLVMSK